MSACAHRSLVQTATKVYKLINAGMNGDVDGHRGGKMRRWDDNFATNGDDGRQEKVVVVVVEVMVVGRWW